jgi:hypothetical protein
MNEPYMKTNGCQLPRIRSCLAFSLIELCVVMAVSFVVLGAATSLLVGLNRWNYRFRDQAVRAEQLALLSETIRSEIRDATDVSLPARDSLRIAGPDERTIRYTLTPAGCERTVQVGDDPVESRDLFRVGENLVWKLEPVAADAPLTVIVTLERNDRDAAATQLLIAATRGADLELAPPRPQGSREESAQPSETQ